jgi:hypothetical protein
MKTILICVVAALAAAGCARGIERPGPVSRAPTVGISSAAGATVPANSCTWAGQATSNGGMSCQQGQQFRCNNGTWDRTALSC